MTELLLYTKMDSMQRDQTETNHARLWVDVLVYRPIQSFCSKMRDSPTRYPNVEKSARLDRRRQRDNP
jgi:hypothetical protein